MRTVNCTLLMLFFIVKVMGAYSSFISMGGPRRTLGLFVHFTVTGNLMACNVRLVLTLFSVMRNIVSAVVGDTNLKTGSSAALPSRVMATVRRYNFFRDVPL